MAQACNIETLDRSGRWYLTPGAKSIYDLRVRNDSNNPIDCTVVLEDPASGVSVDPLSFALRGHEVRTVTVTVAADAPIPRSQRVLLTLRDQSGAVQATFEHPLIVTGGTDCSISLAWKDTLVEAGEVRGFELTCCVRSQSDGPTSFALAFTPHPALKFPQLDPISLDPGESAELTVPVQWDPAIQDDNGLNHPLLLEVAVPVSNGRRTSRMRWDAIDAQMQPFVWNSVLAAVQASPAMRNGEQKKGALEQVASAPSAAGNGSTTPSAPDSQDASAPAPQAATNGANATADGPREAAPAPSGVASEEQVAPAGAAAGSSLEASAAAPVLNGQATAEQPPVPVPENTAANAAAPSVQPEPSVAAPKLPSAAARLQPRRPLESQQKRKFPAGLLIGGLAAIALVIAAVLFRPSNLQQTTSDAPVVINTPVIAMQSAQPLAPTAAANLNTHKPAAHKPNQIAPKVLAPSAQPAPTVKVATPAAATAVPSRATRTSPATPKPTFNAAAMPQAAVPQAPVQQRQRQLIRRMGLIAALRGPVVALGDVEAHYGAGGRAVRVNWAAAEQIAANVQLIDAHGTTVNSITVRGARQSVLLYLPPRYRGSVTVQLTSTGRLGERVAQTAFLPPFGD